jgi:4a-hydroxytetrahydrobiopterin dehydratase
MDLDVLITVQEGVKEERSSSPSSTTLTLQCASCSDTVLQEHLPTWMSVAGAIEGHRCGGTAELEQATPGGRSALLGTEPPGESLPCRTCDEARGVIAVPGVPIRWTLEVDEDTAGPMVLDFLDSIDSGEWADTCVPCHAGRDGEVDVWDATAVRSFLAKAGRASEWTLEPVARLAPDTSVLALHRRLDLSSFAACLRAIQVLGALAEEAGHHPDLHLEAYSHLHIVLFTHSVGGITDADMVQAMRAEAALTVLCQRPA